MQADGNGARALRTLGRAQPVRVLEVETGNGHLTLAAPTQGSAADYDRAKVLVRLHGKPLGLVECRLAGELPDPADLAGQIRSELGAALDDHLRSDGVGGVGPGGSVPTLSTPPCAEPRRRASAEGPAVSVIIATHDRSEGLARTLRSLIALDYRSYEIVVVDSAPSTTATQAMLAHEFSDVDNLRYVRLATPGLTPARTKGIDVASGDVVAFTDDDVVVDRYWLAELVAAFAADTSVACVTGLTHPLELDTPAQILFEEYGGFGRGFERRIYDLHANHPGDRLFPYALGRVGSGNNMAWNKRLLAAIGGFDLALTHTGAEDISAFFDALTRGYAIVYEPAAIVFHEHRRDYEDLKRQVYWYGIGLGAYLARCSTRDARSLVNFAAHAPFGLSYLLSASSAKNIKKSETFPRELTRLERRGTWRGVLRYLQGRLSRPRRQSITRVE
jgi:glycosyltransferase involved in cell wall biosynthesis